MDINARLKEIEDLEIFLDEKKEILTGILHKLGWSEESMQDEIKIPCPIDPGHWLPESSIPHHKELCSWVKEGYVKEDKEKQPSSSSFFYEHSSSVIPFKLDKELQANILAESELGGLEKKPLDELPDIPQTIDRWTVHLNPEQRLAIYDYVIREGKVANRPKNVTVEDLMFDFEKKDDQDGKPKTELEIMAEQRDYKRRRQSYRAKNVHITKKSYTEVMKEVIENQITFLAETRKQESAESLADANKEYSAENNPGNPSDQASSYDSWRKEGSHHSRNDRSDTSSPKRRKHKRRESRSPSRSRHKHKKSHRKHKKSHD